MLAFFSYVAYFSAGSIFSGSLNDPEAAWGVFSCILAATLAYEKERGDLATRDWQEQTCMASANGTGNVKASNCNTAEATEAEFRQQLKLCCHCPRAACSLQLAAARFYFRQAGSNSNSYKNSYSRQWQLQLPIPTCATTYLEHGLDLLPHTIRIKAFETLEHPGKRCK